MVSGILSEIHVPFPPPLCGKPRVRLGEAQTYPGFRIGVARGGVRGLSFLQGGKVFIPLVGRPELFCRPLHQPLSAFFWAARGAGGFLSVRIYNVFFSGWTLDGWGGVFLCLFLFCFYRKSVAFVLLSTSFHLQSRNIFVVDVSKRCSGWFFVRKNVFCNKCLWSRRGGERKGTFGPSRIGGVVCSCSGGM